MKTFFTKKLRLAASAVMTTLATATLLSCGGSDSGDYDDTTPYFPEFSITGFELSGSIEIENYSESFAFYYNRIVSIYFIDDTYAQITYDDASTATVDYEYTPYDSDTALISLRVPAALTSEIGAEEYYVLTLENPSSHFRVQLGLDSWYQTRTYEYYFYAEDGFLEFYYAE